MKIQGASSIKKREKELPLKSLDKTPTEIKLQVTMKVQLRARQVSNLDSYRVSSLDL